MFAYPPQAPARSDRHAALLLGAGYLVLAFFPLLLTRFDNGVAYIWIASSLLTARLSMLPVRRWGWPLACCAFGGAVAIASVGLGPMPAPVLVVVGLAESMVAAWIIRRVSGDESCFDSVRGVATFTVAAGVVAPLVSGIPGGAVATLVTGIPYYLNLVHWFASHAVGTLTFTPIVMLGLRGDIAAWARGTNRREALVTLALMAVVAIVVFATFWQSSAPILFLPMLPMLLATIVRGRLGAAGSTILLALIGGLLSFNGHGPITLLDGATGTRTLFFQFYVACATVLVLPVAALLKAQSSLMKQLSVSEAKYRTIADRSGDAILDIAADGTIRFASPAIHDLIGIAASVLVGRNARTLVHADDVAMVWKTHQQALAEPDVAHSAQYRGAGGADAKWFETSMRAVVTDQGDAIGVIGSVRDISERKATELELASAANTDLLTGLANRRAFMTLLELRIRDDGGTLPGASVALFDLDHFKTVNDRYGHATGDEVLRAFATVARRIMRTDDTFARIGGEEFAVLLPNCTPAQAYAVCERFRDAVHDTVIAIPGVPPFSVTVSAGIARISRSTDPGAVLRAADEALYRAKDAGRNCLKEAA